MAKSSMVDERKMRCCGYSYALEYFSQWQTQLNTSKIRQRTGQLNYLL